ncbi:ABC transporter permease [Arenicella sp. 4NH20-0111]|uniref:ABC transporter permease n=1 Tax=Arenicella sp. 4NH20-0111 TaxID=3127648 RepID=UPI003102F1B9
MNNRNQLALAVEDFKRGFKDKGVWLALGWNDVQGRYNRSKLGVFWASLSILIFVCSLGPIYSRLFNVSSPDYVLYLMLGLIVWNYMHGIILESGREYVNSVNYIVSFQLSYFTLLLRVVWRNLVVLGYQMLVFLGLSILLGKTWYLSWIIIPVSLLIITVNALWMGVLVSVMATRFRDLGELLNNIFRLVFFVTPIMWMPEIRSDLEIVAQLNPFYHLIEIYRGALLSGSIEMTSWIISLLLAFAGWVVAFPVFAVFRSRIAFWI